MFIQLTNIKGSEIFPNTIYDVSATEISDKYAEFIDSDLLSSWNLEADNIFISELYDKCIIILSEKLNLIHETDFSEHYWKIVIGTWLRFYLYVFYKRYNLLKRLESRYGRFQTLALHEDSFIYPKDTLEMMDLLKEDRYNLQIYTQIINELNMAEIVEHVGHNDPDESESLCSIKKSNFIPRTIISIYMRAIRNRKKIIMFAAYFPIKARLKFFFKSLGRVVSVPNWFISDVSFSSVSYDHSIREEVGFSFGSDDKFEKLCCKFISKDLPMCFVENYSLYSNQASEMLSIFGNCRGLISSTFWHYHEIFKMMSGVASEGGIPLYSIQHGGTYGNTKVNVLCDHEVGVVTRFYSWGWGCGKIKALSCSKLVGLDDYRFTNDNNDILYGLTSFPRFDSFYSEMNPKNFSKYLQDQKTFIGKLDSNAFNKLVVRCHHDDLGWKIKKAIKGGF